MTDEELAYFTYGAIRRNFDPENLKIKDDELDALAKYFCKVMTKEIRRAIPKGKHDKTLEICIKKIDRFISRYRDYNPNKRAQIKSKESTEYESAYRDLFSGIDDEILCRFYNRYINKYLENKPSNIKPYVRDEDYDIPSDVEEMERNGVYMQPDKDSLDETDIPQIQEGKSFGKGR